jgi:outer membrane lipoprotein SlyB
MIAVGPTSSQAAAVGAAFGVGTGLVVAGPVGAVVGGVVGAVWGTPFWATLAQSRQVEDFEKQSK